MPLDKTVDDLLLTCFLKLDGELVAVNSGNSAVAEFLMEDAFTHLKVGIRSCESVVGFQLKGWWSTGCATLGLARAGALPAGGSIVTGKGRLLTIETADAIAAILVGCVFYLDITFG